MSAPTLRHRWTQEDFLLAEAAGAFKGRVGLVGEPDSWHRGELAAADATDGHPGLASATC